MAQENLNSVNTEIEVNGEPCDFLYMSLKQSMTNHHVFEIAVMHRYDKPGVWEVAPENIFKMLYAPVNIRFTHRESGDKTEFSGVVTDIDIVGQDGDQGFAILKGGDPTLLLDRDPAMGAFVDYTLQNIVGEVLEKSGVKVEVQNKPKFAHKIPYVARYKETSYGFLSRVLGSFNEWFYYDGKQLIVGNPGNMESRDVYYNMELREVKMSAGLRNLNTELYDYNPLENDYMEDGPTQNTAGQNYLADAIRKQSDTLYPTPSKLPTERPILFEKDIVQTMRTHQGRAYSQLITFTATSNCCGVKVGGLATAIIPKTFEKVSNKDMGRYRVLEITHTVGKDGHYENKFKGIFGSIEALPADNIMMPTAFPEPAIVVDNADPRNQGRVKVRYYWQKKGDSMATTGWIRVQTPDAGKSDNVPTNRGFVFIPEIDDQVMIGFEKGDPSRPYVMGSLFHRDNSEGAATDNIIKSIKTRAGHIIEFNDSEDGLAITIKDRKDNIIHIDSAGDNINVSANKNVNVTAGDTMNLKAKTLNIEVEENMTTTVGKDQKSTVGGKVENSANEFKETIAQNATVEVGQKLSEKTGETKMVSDGDFIVKADGKALIQGAQDARVSKG